LADRFPAYASAAPSGRIYVSNAGSGTVSAIDPATNTVIATITTDASPYGVAVTPNGERLWVANYLAQNLYIIDTATNAVEDGAAIVGNPHSIAFNETGTRAYVTVSSSTNPDSANTVWVFDTTVSPPFPMATIPVGTGPTGITARPDGQRLYVANYDGNAGTTVSVIDTATNLVTATVTVGTGPFQIGMSPDGTRAYVVNLSSDNVSVLDTGTNTVVATVAVGNNPAFAAVSPAGDRVYVTNVADNSVSVIDTATNTVITTFASGGGGPRGIALSPDGSRVYVANSSANAVSVIPTDGSPATSVSVGTDPFFVAVVPGAAISGVARCDNGDGSTLLPGATVELYSGSALVDTTVAALRTAEFSFTDIAPNSTYRLRFSLHVVTEFDEYTISCWGTLTTDPDGNATTEPGTFIPNRHNHIWPTAYPLVSDVPITDYIFREGQSTWFKIPVKPGQRVSVKMTNVPANYSLGLYKDIRQLYDQQIAALSGSDPLGAIANIDAAVAPDALSPDELSPDELSPDELSPDELSPDELSPDELSPDELSPDELSPDELSPDALSPDELSPDELSPDELSPDELSADAYAAAQTAALIGVSAHVGLSPEQIARNTWENTGFFYMRVRGHNGAFDASLPFTIEASVTDVSCTGVTLTEYPVTFTAPAADTRSIILTNTARLGAGDTTAFANKLGALASHATVGGVVVNLAALPAVQSAYAQWDAHPDCPAAANVVARSIKGVIDAYRATNTGLKFVVLAGNDHVLPFYRTPDQSGLGSEKDYHPAVLDTTFSQASLRLGYVLTQDYYGNVRPISRFDHVLYLPDLAVGRLVESISDMTAVVDAYLATDGVVAPTQALVVGYDFLSDAAGFIADQLQANALTVDRELIQPVGDQPTDPTAWTAQQLSTKLLGATTFGILSINAHFSANSMLAADYSTRLRTTDITSLPATDTRFRNALVLSTGCHSSYNIVDPHATSLTEDVDWTQAFAARGATMIGGTGYQYGDTDFIKYTEQLHANTTLQLRYGTGPVAIGTALANAKRTYISTLPTLNGIDEKSLVQATLYGLPMLAYDLPAGSRLAVPPSPVAPSLTPGTSAGLSLATITPAFTLHRNNRTLSVVGGGTETAIYWDIDGNVAVTPEAPVLPVYWTGVGAPGNALRGAVLQSATYNDEAGLIPFTDVATTEVRGIHPRYETEVFTPVRPFDLNHFAGSNLVSTPYQFRSTPGSSTGVARTYSSETFRLYYSNLTDLRALAASPVVYNVTLTPNGPDVDVVVTVGALTAVGIEDVFVTHTAEAGSLYGEWTSFALTPGTMTTNGAGFARTYTGSIARGTSLAEDVRVLIQAVGGNGLVTWASNNGAYYSVINETATAADPKASTELGLVVPATGTYRSTVEVRARLTTLGEALAGKRISFRSGGVRVDATTGSDGWATAQLLLASAPGTAAVTVGFAEDLDYLGSGDETSITVLRAPSVLTPSDTAPLPVGGSVLIATLLGSDEVLGGQLVTLSGGGNIAQTFTDGYGRVRLDTLDGFPSGAYSVAIDYAGNDRYLPAATVTVLIVVYDPTTFVTGGGWILAPSDAIGLTVDKKMNFGVNMKYKTGTTVPTGSVELQAKDSNVTFKATSLDWLAISGDSAEAQGHGTVNGAAGWSFRVVLLDGAPDRFEIRIWQDGVTTYDTPTYRAGNALGGGNVLVH
ncbi:MAG TPA: beta-propeller fold lactonase family protein, partial [Candidatus Limnocylindria bacterium]|nr:beta-propeller fold lactonase family protein [Candidatus Limnocylindria bacterium]